MSNPSDGAPIEIYVALMEEVKTRLEAVEAVGRHQVTFGLLHIDWETAALQLRKVLELIAFGSHCAHKGKYAEANANFRQHWKACRMLEALDRIHPPFFPVPMYAETHAHGRRRLHRVETTALSRRDFEVLYDACSDVLHTRNPFNPKPAETDFTYPLAEWVRRIRALLNLHYIDLAGSDDRWLVAMAAPHDQRVHAYVLKPVPDSHSYSLEDGNGRTSTDGTDGITE
jgi:hypothetical protein